MALSTPCLPFQPLLLEVGGTQRPVQPANGRHFRLAELYQLLDCQLVQVIYLSATHILITDEESKLVAEPQLNPAATRLWWRAVPEVAHLDAIAGPALYCHTTQFR